MAWRNSIGLLALVAFVDHRSIDRTLVGKRFTDRPAGFQPTRVGPALTFANDIILPPGENIDPNNVGAQYAWAENAGWLNAEPTASGHTPDVQVSDAALTGYMYFENLGWLSLSCENTNSCSTTSYGITNDGAGNLAGRAWSENAGWVDFSPTINGNPVGGVTIDPSTGKFEGYAWGENIGWVSFTLPPQLAQYQIETSWRPVVPNTPPVANAGHADRFAAGLVAHEARDRPVGRSRVLPSTAGCQ